MLLIGKTVQAHSNMVSEVSNGLIGEHLLDDDRLCLRILTQHVLSVLATDSTTYSRVSACAPNWVMCLHRISALR